MRASKEQQILEYFREVPDLELANAILNAAAGILQRREKMAQRKPRTNATAEAPGAAA
jgi:hypothetical protein